MQQFWEFLYDVGFKFVVCLDYMFSSAIFKARNKYIDDKNNGVGIPSKNPNLSDDVVKKVDEVFKKIQSGDIKVAAEMGSLIK
ncbi:MAG: hypothetical protein N3I35_01800 [Clostridia bacterium]|nr:hypothetical protein [Clostridia bacterium]